MNKTTKPNNLLECLILLDEILKDSPDIDWFINASEDEVLKESHHGLGFWVRDNWGINENGELFRYFRNLGFNHPDDMSSVIIISYHRYKLGREIKLEEQAKESMEFWRNKNYE